MKPLLHLYIIFLLSLCFPVNLFSEGTKQILLSDAGHGKIQVMPGFNNFAWYTSGGVSATEQYRLHIHIANIGETIYYGFGDPLNQLDGVVTDVTYRIKDPSGTIVVGPSAVPLSGTGHIGTFAAAVAGPAAIAGSSGYTALSYTPPVDTGDYFIEFNFVTGGFSGHDRTKFRYFDITVASAANVAIDGRVWSKGWQMTADAQAPPAGEYTFLGKLFPYSDDGIVTSINFNGMEPFVFAVSCNPWGCYNTGNFNNDRRSVGGNHTLTQYKIFLNDPDSLVYPTGILGMVVPPVLVAPNCNGSASIQVEVTKAGNLDILLDINPLPGIQAEDVSIAWTATVGVNTIPWNGLNGLGQQVPNGSTFNGIVTYINGLTNLPIYDVEENPNGFIIELERPVGPIPPVFWDDIMVGGSQNFTGCTSVLPSTGCHVFSGDANTMNTWWYAVTSVSSPVLFTELRKPNIPGTITGPTPLCPGVTSKIYWIHAEVNSTGYIWGYTGTGATIVQVNDTTISVDYANNATSGNITVSGSNAPCGAGTAQTKAITIQQTPVVSLLPYPAYCIDAPSFTLTGGSPVGGIYSIGGFPVAIFDPAAQGTGSHTVTYTYTDPNTTCTASSTQNIIVNPLPVVSFPQLMPVCINIPPFTITGGIPLGGVYSGIGVVGGIFDPSTAGAGIFNIIYTYTDANGCINSATSQITVYPLPSLTFPPLTPVCISTAPFSLSGATPNGGVYSGVGVVGGFFNPGSAGVGTHLITYIYTNSHGCTDSITQSITVNPLPDAAGSISGAAALCQGATNIIYTVSPIVNALTYVWSVSPPSAGTITGSSTSATMNWAAIFTGPSIIFVKGVNNCGDGAVSVGFTVAINPKPIVTFTLCNDSITTTSAKPFQLKGGIPLGGTYSGTGVNPATGIFTPSAAGPGTRTIQYNYSNSFGCSGSASKNIIVVAPGLFTCGNRMTDVRDTRQYKTVLFGTQCWMAENLNFGTTRGSAVIQRDNCVAEKYCYNDISANCVASGALYQWDEIMQYNEIPGKQGLCPPGWHLPSETEWNLLFSNFINNGFAGSALKSTGYSGFNALLSGAGFFNKRPDFINFATLFWSCNPEGPFKAWAHGMNEYNPSVSFYPSSRSNAFPVRCVKD